MKHKIQIKPLKNLDIKNSVFINISVQHKETKQEDYFIPISADKYSTYIPFVNERYDYRDITTFPNLIY